MAEKTLEVERIFGSKNPLDRIWIEGILAEVVHQVNACIIRSCQRPPQYLLVLKSPIEVYRSEECFIPLCQFHFKSLKEVEDG